MRRLVSNLTESMMVTYREFPSKDEGAFRIIALGDVVGRPGRDALKQRLKELRSNAQADLVIANAENAAGGAGIDAGTALEIRDTGVDLITLGDHAFQRKGSAEFLDKNSSWCIRPYNLPMDTTPGRGSCVWTAADGTRVALINLMGRVFMGGTTECPFRAVRRWLDSLGEHSSLITLCDMHAEATSEKWALGRYVDGELSLVVGTHTHVQTADAQVLPGGTGFITDLGMTGSNNGVIGMSSEVALNRFLGPKPAPYEIAPGVGILRGVIADIDRLSCRARALYLLECSTS
jgi:metallophosphoesterase (TIGR00282 family)